MTVETHSNIVSYNGDGVAVTFPFNFPVYDASHVTVYRKTILTGDKEELTPVAYSVAGVGDPDGGSVTIFGNPVPATEKVIIVRLVPLTQELDVSNQGGFYPESYEQELDLLEMQIQQIKEESDRALRYPIGENVTPMWPAPQRAEKFLAFDHAGVLRLATTGELAKGDPGGNTESIGLFEDANTMIIPDGTDMVRTSGFVILGIGAAYYFADAAVDTAYVAANSYTSFISANGRGFRLYTRDGVSPQQVGCIGDGEIDDSVALQVWLDLGGKLQDTGGVYRSSQTLSVRRTIWLSGSGYGFDDLRETAGSLTKPTQFLFDEDVSGFDLQPQVTTLTWPNGAATQEGAFNSVIENISIKGGGGVGSATGLHSRVLCHLKNVAVSEFSGAGFDISASLTFDPLAEYGNASLSTLTACTAWSNLGRGFHIRGRDANVIKLDSCNAFGNGDFGFDDDGFLGNQYINCHAAGNVGSYRGIGSVANHTYIGCYVEDDGGRQCDLSYRCIVAGGPLTGGALLHNTGTNGIPQITGAAGAVFTNAQFKLAQNSPGPLDENNGTAYVYRHANDGLVLQGVSDLGGETDFALKNSQDEYVMRVAKGSQNLFIHGGIVGIDSNYRIGPTVAPGISPAVGAAGDPPTAAEFGALVDKFNTLLTYLRVGGGYHGLINI